MVSQLGLVPWQSQIRSFMTFPKVSRSFSHGKDIAQYKAVVGKSLKIQTLEKMEFANNQLVYQSLIEITRPSYQDPENILKKDWNYCNRLYLGFQGADLVCFFMVSRESLQLKNRFISTVYLGLTCTHQKTKNSGLVSQLFSHFIDEAQEWQKREREPIPLWYTTATPATYNSASRLFKDSQPYLDKTFTPEAEEIVKAVKKKMEWSSFSGNHPFVVKGIAKARYSELEIERIEKFKKEKKFTLLEELDVHEAQGDRLIGVCYLPDRV